MKPTRAVLLLIFIAGLGGSIVASVLQQKAQAARNSTGTYSLPSGNPVTTGTTITSTWANNTLSDMGTELTNSLDRQGRGAMSAPLQIASGTVSAPGLTFSAEPVSGLYRAASHDVRMSINSNDVEKWLAAGVSITGTASVSGAATLSNTASVGGGMAIDTGAANDGGIASNSLIFGNALGSSGEGIVSKRTSGTNQYGLDLYTGSVDRLSITNTGLVQIPGAFAATPGTGISGSYGASFSIAHGNLTAPICSPSTQSLSGVAVGGVCHADIDGIGAVAAFADCYVSGANAVNIRLCQLASGDLGTLTYRVRVFQP